MDHSEKASCIVSKSCSMTTAANCRQRCTGLQLILILQYEKIWNKTSLSQVPEESHHIYYCSVTELLQSIFRPVTGFARERIIVCFNISYFEDFSLYSFQYPAMLGFQKLYQSSQQIRTRNRNFSSSYLFVRQNPSQKQYKIYNIKQIKQLSNLVKSDAFILTASRFLFNILIIEYSYILPATKLRLNICSKYFCQLFSQPCRSCVWFAMFDQNTVGQSFKEIINAFIILCTCMNMFSIYTCSKHLCHFLVYCPLPDMKKMNCKKCYIYSP